MAIACATVTTAGATLHFEICPTWQAGACACAKDANGNPEPPHPLYTFGSTLPVGWALATAPAEWVALGKTQAQWTALTVAQQWAFCCAIEAIRLVKAQQAAAATAVPSLVGVTA